jgi:hypothetical protein
MSSEIISMFDKLGTPGLLMAAVWFVAKKLSDQYENRISALEKRSDECEQDRVKIRDMLLGYIQRHEGDQRTGTNP